MPDLLVTILSVSAMILGFGAIVAIHEFGHFIAARWAGIRVHAFAVGFGSALISYRKGFGIQRGSSAERYDQLLEQERTGLNPTDTSRISPTEYRLNWIPFGGYVKMLGQEDLDPNATSDQPDSYQTKPVWKRMVVISAGVILNIVLAAVLFIAVYTAGIATVAPVAGTVADGSPAARAGVQPGDRFLAVNGETTPEFREVVVAVAMSPADSEVTLTIDRPGEPEPITLTAEPTTKGALAAGLREINVFAARSTTTWPEALRASERQQLDLIHAFAGVPDLPRRSTLVTINAADLPTYTLPSTQQDDEPQTYRLFSDAQDIIESLPIDRPATLTFQTPTGDTVNVSLAPEAAFQASVAPVRRAPGDRGDGDADFATSHLLGLTPLMQVAEASMQPPAQGLQPGDVFLAVGSRTYPTMPEAISEIRTHADQNLTLTILRGNTILTLDVTVTPDGTVGFNPEPALDLPILGTTPDYASPTAADNDGDTDTERSTPSAPWPANRLAEPILPGSRITAVNDQPVSSFSDLRAVMRSATADALDNDTSATLTLDIAYLPPPNSLDTATENPLTAALDTAQTGTITLDLTAAEVRALHDLGQRIPGFGDLFEPVQVFRQADNPAHAVGMGVAATKRILRQTYLTLRRLVEGTVPANQLQGPVGITYTGSRFAEQGLIHFLFFLALISANLAVINFLPIPITDGGQFLLLTYEGIRGKPAPIAVQNILTLAGLALIATLFLYVTFHDILRLF